MDGLYYQKRHVNICVNLENIMFCVVIRRELLVEDLMLWFLKKVHLSHLLKRIGQYCYILFI